MFHLSKIKTNLFSFVMARVPDWTAKYLVGSPANSGVPKVILARGVSHKGTHDISNFVRLFVNRKWDASACNHEGGIQVRYLREYMKYFHMRLVWICYTLGNSQGIETGYILLDLNAPQTLLYRYTASDRSFSRIKKITEPAFGEIPFSANSTWE